jgi:hypothetical protein
MTSGFGIHAKLNHNSEEEPIILKGMFAEINSSII